MTTSVLRTILGIDIVIMALLAIVFLSQRRLEWRAYCAWGLLAVLVPLLGPFLVVVYHPGVWRTPPTANTLPFGVDALRILSNRAIVFAKTHRVHQPAPTPLEKE